ncbi:MAG: lysophospholipid acyltransferase family protein [Pseudomonadota bacterium]
MTAAAEAALAQRSELLTRLFCWYLKGFLAKRLHAMRRLGPPPQAPAGAPAVVYTNHPGWWDPIIMLRLSRDYFSDRRNFGAIDADALDAYAIFRRVGLFGVDPDPLKGAAQFLRVSACIFEDPATSLWVTPQGRFSDVRERPLGFRPGLGRLASRHPQAVFLPLAIEYAFWEEAKPEAFVRFGAPVRGADLGDDANAALEARLAETLDGLSAAVAARDPAPFATLLDGGSGVAWYYEAWRRAKAALKGERYSAAHRDVKK